MKFPKFATVYLEKLFFGFLNFFGAFRNCINIPLCNRNSKPKMVLLLLNNNEKQQHGKYNKEYCI